MEGCHFYRDFFRRTRRTCWATLCIQRHFWHSGAAWWDLCCPFQRSWRSRRMRICRSWRFFWRRLSECQSVWQSTATMGKICFLTTARAIYSDMNCASKLDASWLRRRGNGSENMAMTCGDATCKCYLGKWRCRKSRTNLSSHRRAGFGPHAISWHLLSFMVRSLPGGHRTVTYINAAGSLVVGYKNVHRLDEWRLAIKRTLRAAGPVHLEKAFGPPKLKLQSAREDEECTTKAQNPKLF